MNISKILAKNIKYFKCLLRLEKNSKYINNNDNKFLCFRREFIIFF